MCHGFSFNLKLIFFVCCQVFFSCFTGKNIAAIAEIATVRIIVLVPPDNVEIMGSFAKQKLAIKLIITNPAITLFFFAGGTIIAINIPNNATLSAPTILSGKIFPAITPIAVPIDQPGIAKAMAPYV